MHMMGKKNYLKFALSLMITMLFFSCSKTENGNVEYIPFQETDDGHWGMISMDGKVLFKDEFKNKPTVVRDGRFFARTSEGVWEMYDASEKPKKIGADYAHTSGTPTHCPTLQPVPHVHIHRNRSPTAV